MRSLVLMIALVLAVAAAAAPQPADAQSCTTSQTAARFRNSVAQVISSHGSGTAFYIGDGEWVTAAHVVDTDPTVQLRNARQNLTATVTGVRSDIDLAVLSASSSARTMTWATPQAGESTILLGYGIGQRSRNAGITTGIVSEVFESEGLRFVRTDTAANPGHSGGPLLDQCGQVVGVILSGIPSVQNVAYALAGDEAAALLESVRLAGPPPDRTEFAEWMREWQSLLAEWRDYFFEWSGTETTDANLDEKVEAFRATEVAMEDAYTEIWTADKGDYGPACERAQQWTARFARSVSLAAMLEAIGETHVPDWSDGGQDMYWDHLLDLRTSSAISGIQADYWLGECEAGR